MSDPFAQTVYAHADHARLTAPPLNRPTLLVRPDDERNQLDQRFDEMTERCVE